jgi:hypothetical protein
VDTIPAIAGDCLTKKGYRGAGAECHAITQIATDRTFTELHTAPDRFRLQFRAEAFNVFQPHQLSYRQQL